MCKILKYCLFFILIIEINNSNAQKSIIGIPWSFNTVSIPLKKQGIPFFLLPKIDNLLEQKQDSIRNASSGLKKYYFAKSIETSINIYKYGEWQILPSGDKIWQIKINSENAYGLCLILNDYLLPTGSKLYVYSSDKKQIIGAFTSQNNNDNGILALQDIYSDEVIIEYNEPANVDFKGNFTISSIGHIYKRTKDGEFGKSASCEVDINCPQGADWQNEKHSVVRIGITEGSNVYYCSGVLINNVKKDGMPYILTANHCINNQTLANNSVFYFNYESPTCKGADGKVYQSLSSAWLVATPKDAGIDFALLKLKEIPTAEYKPFYVGWDINTNASLYSVVIHHPEGDVKKISIDTDNGTSGSYVSSDTDYLPNTHWNIGNWEVGATEGGSSGAPLFNQKKMLVGTLTGGLAVCGNPVDDYFSKFSAAWATYPNMDEQLKHWLDPDGTDSLTIQSSEKIYEPHYDDNLDQIIIYPNPANRYIWVNFDKYKVEKANFELIDIFGRRLFLKDEQILDNKYFIDMNFLKSGIYLIKIIINNDVELVKKIVVIRQ